MKYLGNKSRLADFLSDSMSLSQRTGQTGVDAFSGTGAVSFLMKSNGISTYSNDFLNCCYHIVKAKLLDSAPLPKINWENASVSGFIHEKYSESCGVNIFQDSVTKSIDGYRQKLEAYRGNLSDEEYSFFLAQIIEAADFRSNIMGSYESFYKKGWRKQCLKQWELPEFELIDNQGRTKHEVENKDVFQFLSELPSRVDFIYLDPPYNSRQYSSVFHLLETISLYDSPVVSGKVNKRKDDTKKSSFSSKVKVQNSFENILSLCSDMSDETFVSYSTEGLLSIDEICHTARRYFPHTEVKYKDYRRFKTNDKTKKTNLQEVIIKCS